MSTIGAFTAGGSEIYGADIISASQYNTAFIRSVGVEIYYMRIIAIGY